MANTIPTRTLTARDYQTVYDALVAYIKRTRPELWTDFFQSNLGMVMIEMLSGVTDWASYGQDAALLETFLATCRRYESGLSFARSVGYVPMQAFASSASVVANIPGSSPLFAYGGIIRAGSVIQGDNGLLYEFTNDLSVPAGGSSVRSVVIQGSSYSETFSLPTTPNPTAQVSNGNVAQGSWQVFVGDPTDPSNEWRQVAAVALEPTASNTYEVQFDDASKLTVRFGDGTYGALPTQSVTVTYRTCGGAAGNTPVNTIRGTVTVRLNSPATGTASIDFVNYDPSAGTEGNVGVQTGELGPALPGGTGSFAVVVPLSNVPIKPGSVTVTLRFASSGGQIVLQDDSYGNLTVTGTTCAIPDLTNPPTNLLGVTAAYLNYGNGTCNITLTSDVDPIYAGQQPISDYDYFTKVDPSAALVQGAASGGADREDLERLRSAVKAFMRSQDRLITTSDYDQGLKNVAGVALAKTDARPLAYTGNVVRLNLWSDETIGFRSVAYDGLIGSGSYRRYAQASSALGSQVQQYVKSKSLVTAHHVIQLPGILWVDLYFRELFFVPTADAQAVRDGVTNAVLSLFQNSSGFELRLSNLYAAIYAVPGVAYFTLYRVAVGTRSQTSPAEAVGITTVSTTLSCNLLSVGSNLNGAILSPGTLRLSIIQGADRLILADDGLGHMVLVAGASNSLDVVGNTVDYITGAVQLTFLLNLSANETVYATYDNVSADYRQNTTLTKNSLSDGDYWPSPAALQNAPVATADKLYNGRPLTPPGSVGIEYEALTDIVIESAVVDLRFFDDTYLYDNSFYFDSELRFNRNMQALNLRTLDFNAVVRA